MITVVTMCRDDAELFCQVVDGRLSDEQRDEWMKAHDCDYDDDMDENNMFFQEFEGLLSNNGKKDLKNVDGGV